MKTTEEMKAYEGIAIFGLVQVMYWEVTYWPKAIYLLFRHSVYKREKRSLGYYLKLIAKRKCRLGWLR